MAVLTGGLQAGTITAPVESYFDAPTTGTGRYHVVGSITPPSWSWGKIELLEGHQTYRTEAYNTRTEKLRFQDTFQSADYPLQTYWGDLNQQLVDSFNLAYKLNCGNKGSTLACGEVGPTRPEARYVLLHQGPQTAKGLCNKTLTPMLLVHGAMQDGNVWLYPGGNDGKGNGYEGADTEGPVKWLETAGVCTYAVTFGNFHGDNISQAINLRHAMDRVRELGGSNKVDVAAWSKGVVVVDLYGANISTWTDWSSSYFDQIVARQAREVPAFVDDIGTYFAISGPHKGLDLNWRHPYDNILIATTDANAPIGRGPMVWSRFSAIQCPTWGYLDSPNTGNIYAEGLCTDRGGLWPDFWDFIYLTNITRLDSQGQIVWGSDLDDLNINEGLSPADFEFDEYNISVFGAVNTSGEWINPYLGQLQVVNDFRSEFPVPCHECDPYNWGETDTDETYWFDWLEAKLAYNPYWWLGVGGFLTDNTHVACRETAYAPATKPCLAKHMYRASPNAIDKTGKYATYELFNGLGLETARLMGGRLMERLQNHSLDSRLDNLVVLHGTELGSAFFETDGMACPTCDPNADGVLFETSIMGLAQLTQGWPAASLDRADQVPYSLGHLDIGVNRDVWQDIIEGGW